MLDLKSMVCSPLRPYQNEIAVAILKSAYLKKGLTFTVEIARQGGKNEISARVERHLLTRNCAEAQNLIKCSPTFKPQAFVSMDRLKQKLNESPFRKVWTSESDYIIRVGSARALFLSADRSSNVVGNTAHLLLEVDEAQDVSEEKYSKEFKPMCSTTNCTTVLYGTTWDDSTLLEKMKQLNLEMERQDGIKRHFRHDWQEIGLYNAAYLKHVENEKVRLGPNHPLFLTQYCLQTVKGNNRLFDSLQLAQLQGDHPRLHHPAEHIVINTSVNPVLPYSRTETCQLSTVNSKTYIAGIDLAGEAEIGEADFLRYSVPRLDSTVITIAEIVGAGFEPARFRSSPAFPKDSFPTPFPETSNLRLETGNWKLNIVEHYSFTGIKHPELYTRMIDILKNLWHCKCVVVDATGIGQPVASFLRQALGSRVVPFTFTQLSKSQLGFNLLAAVNSGRLKMYAADNSPQYQEFWFEMEKARTLYRPSQTLNFYLDPADGHDDYLMSLALLVEAAGSYVPREAYGS